MWLLCFFLFDPGQIVVDFEIGMTSYNLSYTPPTKKKFLATPLEPGALRPYGTCPSLLVYMERAEQNQTGERDTPSPHPTTFGASIFTPKARDLGTSSTRASSV